MKIKKHEHTNATAPVFSLVYDIKTSLGLGFMIQFKVKTPNNIFLISTLIFTFYVTSHNISSTSLNLNKKNPNILAIFIMENDFLTTKF